MLLLIKWLLLVYMNRVKQIKNRYKNKSFQTMMMHDFQFKNHELKKYFAWKIWFNQSNQAFEMGFLKIKKQVIHWWVSLRKLVNTLGNTISLSHVYLLLARQTGNSSIRNKDIFFNSSFCTYQNERLLSYFISGKFLSYISDLYSKLVLFWMQIKPSLWQQKHFLNDLKA